LVGEQFDGDVERSGGDAGESIRRSSKCGVHWNAVDEGYQSRRDDPLQRGPDHVDQRLRQSLSLPGYFSHCDRILQCPSLEACPSYADQLLSSDGLLGEYFVLTRPIKFAYGNISCSGYPSRHSIPCSKSFAISLYLLGEYKVVLHSSHPTRRAERKWHV
jgi:hypothetical protein